MRKYIIQFGIVAVLLATIFCLITKLNQTNNEIIKYQNNIHAYELENSNLKDQNTLFQMSLDEFKNSNDSLNLKIQNILKENKIKENRIINLQYQLEHFSKRDTLILRDTIFKDPEFKLDTCLVDKWNKTCLHMEYPGIISIDNEYNNEKYIICNTRKEPVKQLKCKLFQIFVKKRTIIEIDVIDENPYVLTERQRFIEIIE